MDAFFNSLFAALSKELPFLAILIIGATMWLFGSTGVFLGGGKIDDRVRKPLRQIGAFFTYFGSALALIALLLYFLDFIQPYQLYITNSPYAK